MSRRHLHGPSGIGYAAALLWLVAAVAGGCSGKQGYEVVAPADSSAALGASRVVFEGDVYDFTWGRPQTDWRHYLCPVIPAGGHAGDRGSDAAVRVETVLKGDAPEGAVQLRGLRPLTRAERALFPEHYGLHNGSRLRIAYDRRRGERFTGLKLVPLGNTPEMEAVMRSVRQSGEVR